MSERNKELMRSFIEEVFNQGNIEVSDLFIARDYVDHNPWPGFPATVAGFKEGLNYFRAAFPDLNLVIEDMITEGDRVVMRILLLGTHKGDFMDMPATGNAVSVPIIDIVRIADDKIVEHWDVMDELGMLQQLGIVQAQT